MTLLALIVSLSFLGLIVCGLLVHMYLYTHGAFPGSKFKKLGKERMSAASFSQTGMITIPEGAADLYYGGIGAHNSGMSRYQRKLLFYSVALVVTLVVLAVLVVGATQF